MTKHGERKARMSGLEICKIYEYEYEYDDQIVCAEVEKSLFEKKIEKKEGKAYNKQGASKRPNVEV